MADDLDVHMLERHEASVWAKLVESTAMSERNQLHAQVNRAGVTPLPVVAMLDSKLINRVISPECLEAGELDEKDTLELRRICAFYVGLGQQHFGIEVRPETNTPALARELSLWGVEDLGHRVAKVVCATDSLRDDGPSSVVELAPGDREAWIAVTRDAWAVPRLMSPWFGSTFGPAGFRHFGITDGNELVAVGAMHVAGELAWLGLGATRPSHWGRGLQRALLAQRSRISAELGCRWVHSETFLTTGIATNTPLRNFHRAGFTHLYDRIVYEP
jgi:GNAT superfamily N-acetyltransferase